MAGSLETEKVKIEAIGCFADNLPRALSHLYFNARDSNVLDWNAWPNMSSVIDACASRATAEGIQVFGVQHYGECWGQPRGVRSSTYAIYGLSDNCVQGVGGEWTNFVYRILQQGEFIGETHVWEVTGRPNQYSKLFKKRKNGGGTAFVEASIW